MSDFHGFNLSRVFATVGQAVPDREALVWRDRRLTYGEMAARIEGVEHFLASTGLGSHTARDQLAGHESGQDLLALYLRNGNQYLETMIAAYRARLAPFNVNYRYVSEELIYVCPRPSSGAPRSAARRPARPTTAGPGRRPTNPPPINAGAGPPRDSQT